MKIKNILLMIAFLFLLNINLLNADMTMFNYISIRESEQVVRYSGSYYFDDTSDLGVGKSTGIPMAFYIVIQALPFTLDYGEVTWCNFTLSHYANIYNSEGDKINSTVYTTSSYYEATNTTTTNIAYVTAYASDYVIGYVDCYYNDSRDLFSESDLFGRFDTLMPTYECKGCTDYTIEQLTNEVEKGEQVTESQLSIFSILDKIVDYNWTVWLIISWLLNIVFLGVAISLIFYGVYFYYNLFRELAK
jgi:hypothetical protein